MTPEFSTPDNTPEIGPDDNSNIYLGWREIKAILNRADQGASMSLDEVLGLSATLAAELLTRTGSGMSSLSDATDALNQAMQAASGKKMAQLADWEKSRLVAMAVPVFAKAGDVFGKLGPDWKDDKNYYRRAAISAETALIEQVALGSLSNARFVLTVPKLDEGTGRPSMPVAARETIESLRRELRLYQGQLNGYHLETASLCAATGQMIDDHMCNGTIDGTTAQLLQMAAAGSVVLANCSKAFEKAANKEFNITSRRNLLNYKNSANHGSRRLSNLIIDALVNHPMVDATPPVVNDKVANDIAQPEVTKPEVNKKAVKKRPAKKSAPRLDA